jgi:hypothetical protein
LVKHTQTVEKIKFFRWKNWCYSYSWTLLGNNLQTSEQSINFHSNFVKSSQTFEKVQVDKVNFGLDIIKVKLVKVLVRSRFYTKAR